MNGGYPAGPRTPAGLKPPPSIVTQPNDRVLEQVAEVLVAHQRHRGGCLCGWSGLGRSLPDHQTDMLASAGLLKINNLPKEGTP